MSRIGKEPVTIAEGVTCTVAGQKVTVKGKLGELSYEMHDGISAKVEDGKVVVTRKDDSLKALHGLSRALINNMVIGVSAGYTKKLVIEGTGFKAALQGKNLSPGVKLPDSPEHEIHGIERLQPQTCIDLLLGLQHKMDGMYAVVVDLAWNEATNVLFSHDSASLREWHQYSIFSGESQREYN